MGDHPYNGSSDLSGVAVQTALVPNCSAAFCAAPAGWRNEHRAGIMRSWVAPRERHARLHLRRRRPSQEGIMRVGSRLVFPENTVDDYDKVVKALNS
jgi:hypothetical protein